MTNDERFENHIQDASADDLRAMVRAARLAVREYHSQVVRAEQIQEATQERLETAHVECAKFRSAACLMKAQVRARPWVRNGGTQDFERLTRPPSDGLVPF